MKPIGRPFSGSLPNVRTLESALGEAVRLQDGSTISGIFTEASTLTYDSVEAVERQHTNLTVNVLTAGTLAAQQTVTVRGRAYYVASMVHIGDGWQMYILTGPAPP